MFSNLNNRQKPINAIGIISHRHIGDTILIEPIVRILLKSGFEVTVFVKSDLAQNVITYFKTRPKAVVFDNFFKLKHLLKTASLDVVYHFDRSLGSALTSFRTKVAWRFGVGTEFRWLFLSQWIRARKDEHHGLEHQRVFKYSLKKLSHHLTNKQIKSIKFNWDMEKKHPLFSKNKFNCFHRVLNSHYLLLHIGTTRPSKNIPVETYKQIIQIKKAEYKNIILCGDDKEMEKELEDQVNHSFINQTNFEEYCYLISKAAELITPDTSAMHIGSAYGIKVSALFGSTNPKHTGPLGPNTKIYFKNINCSPCFREICKYSPIDKKWMDCLKGIYVE